MAHRDEFWHGGPHLHLDRVFGSEWQDFWQEFNAIGDQIMAKVLVISTNFVVKPHWPWKAVSRNTTWELLVLLLFLALMVQMRKI